MHHSKVGHPKSEVAVRKTAAALESRTNADHSHADMIKDAIANVSQSALRQRTSPSPLRITHLRLHSSNLRLTLFNPLSLLAIYTNKPQQLKERNGSSRQAIKAYVRANNNIDKSSTQFDRFFNDAIKRGVDAGDFIQPKGTAYLTLVIATAYLLS